MKEYKIFLASSSELADDRKAFDAYIGRLKNDWAKKGVLLKVDMWEDFLDHLSPTRLQDEYNKAVTESDIFVMLYHTKVRKYTDEEFEKAFGVFQETGKPKIYTYFRKSKISLDDIPKKDVLSLYAFQEKLEALKHYTNKYENIEGLLLHFRGQLDKLVASGYIKTNEGDPSGNNILPKILGNPPFFPDVFLGREDDLEAIHNKLFQEENLLLLVNGEGGIGKTTLAAVYYQKYAESYNHLAWVFAEKSLLEAVLTLAIPLNIKFGEREPNESRFNRVLAKMRQLTKPCLLVIDNANRLSDLEDHYLALRSCPNFHLLLTTRITEFEQAKTHQILPLTDEKAKALFKRYYKKHQDTEDKILEVIFEAIGKNTLVIELLAKNLSNFNRIKEKYSLVNLLGDLQNKGLLAIQNKEVRVAYQAKGSLRKETPDAIIAAMYDLGELSAAEKRLMAVFAVLPAENIAFDMLETLLPKTEALDDNLLILAQKGWLDFNEALGAFKVSPVIQEVTKIKNKGLLADCKELFDTLNEKLDPDWNSGHLKNTTYEKAIQFAYLAENVINSCEEKNNKIVILCERIGKFFETTGDLIKALFLFEIYNQLEEQAYLAEPDNADFKNYFAISLERLGKTQSSLGDLQKAVEYFEERSRLGKELYASYPQNVKFKNGLAISYEKLGSTQSSLGNLKKALEYFEDYHKLGKELYSSYPQNMNFKNGLAISYSRLGETQSSLGNLEKALEYFEDYHKLGKELYSSDPQNVNFKNGLAISYEKLGLTQSSLGNLEKALEYFEDYNRLTKELYSSDPQNVNFKNGLAISYEKLGSAQSSLGNLDKALQFFKERFRLGKELYDNSPQNVNFKNGLAISYEKLGLTQSSLGNLEKALEYFEDYNRLTKELYSSDPQNVNFKNGLAISYEKLGSAQSSLGNLDKALQFFKERFRLTKELYESYPKNVSFKNGLAISYSKLGLIYEKNENQQEAQNWYNKAKIIWEDMVQQFPNYVKFKKSLNWVEEKLT